MTRLSFLVFIKKIKKEVSLQTLKADIYSITEAPVGRRRRNKQFQVLNDVN